LKEEALDHTMWRNRFGRGFGPVVRQNTEWMKFYAQDLNYMSLSATDIIPLQQEAMVVYIQHIVKLALKFSFTGFFLKFTW
jgi:hypothetical protein